MGLFLLILSKYLLGYLIQSLSGVLALYAFNKTRIELKIFSILTVIFAILIFIIRGLPISPGVHTLLLLIVLSLLGVFVLKIPIRSTIIAALYVGIAITISELIMSIILMLSIGINNITLFLKNELYFALSGIPSTLIFLAVTLFVYYSKTKDKKAEK